MFTEPNILMIKLVAAMTGATATAASPFLSDAVMVDVMVAVCGGFVATAPGTTWNAKLQDLVIGVALGLALGLVMRSGEFGDFTIRASVLLGSVLSTRAVEWVRNPAKSVNDLKAIGEAVRVVFAWLGRK